MVRSSKRTDADEVVMPPSHRSDSYKKGAQEEEKKEEKDGDPKEPLSERKRPNDKRRSGKEGKRIIGKGVPTVRDSTITAPGAVRRGGPDQIASAQSDNDAMADDAADDASQTRLVTAELVNVVNAEVVPAQDLERQIHLDPEEIAKQVALQIINEKNNKDQATKKRKCVRIVGGIVAIVVVVVVLVVAILLTRRKSSPQSTPKPTPTLTSMPTPSPTTVPVNPCKDFPCSSTLSVLGLLQNASNHTFLASYLNREFNSDLYDYLASKQSLFAPTDESFNNLPLPYSLYTLDGYEFHLYYLLGSHILRRTEDISHIFQDETLRTYLSRFRPLSVNVINKTIANGASIVTPDIQASNGYIHVPDRVLIASVVTPTIHDLLGEEYLTSASTTRFSALLNASGLQSTLQQSLASGLTVFAPVDSAFESLDSDIFARLFETPDEAFIKDLVLYHFLAQNQNSLPAGYESARTMRNNASAWITNNNPSNLSYINTAVMDSYIASNGFLHKIDKVLLPPNIGDVLQITTAVTELNTTTFVSLVEDSAQLGDLFNSIVEGYPNLGNILEGNECLTVFAPDERAFGDIDPTLLARLLDPGWLMHLQSLCLNHFTVESFNPSVGKRELSMLSGFDVTMEVLSGFSQPLTYINEMIGGVPIKKIPGLLYSGLPATKGFIQIVGSVLLPPWTSQPVLDSLSEVASVFVSLFQLTSFQSYVNSTIGPVTVLAPTDEALSRLGNQTSNSTFVNQLISRHIIVGNMYTSLLNQSTIVSLANQTLQVVKIPGNGTYIGGALIVLADRLAANGVIHVIDRVL